MAYADSMLDNFRGLASTTRAKEPETPSWQLKYDLRKAVIVDLPDDLKKLSCPVFACDPPGSREAIVTHPGCDGDAPLRCKLEYEAQKRDAQYEHLTLGTLWGDGDGADAAAVLWAGSSKKASLTDVARALDVRSSRGPAVGRDVDLAIRALLRRTRSKAGKKDA